MVADAPKLTGKPLADNRAMLISPKRLQAAIECGDVPFCEQLAERMHDDRLWCFGVVAEDRLLSFAWFHIGRAEAQMNCGQQAATATALELNADSAFVFHAYTHPDARGQRLLGDVLTRGAAWLAEHQGVRRLVGTTDLLNTAARNAFAHAGFRQHGAYWRFGLGPWAAGWYPAPETPILAYGPAATKLSAGLRR